MKSSKDKTVYQEMAQAYSRPQGRLDLNKTIRDLREEKKLSGIELCKKSGNLDPRTLTAVEKGRIRNPSLETLQAIAKGLSISISDIFRRAETTQEEYLYQGSQKGFFQMEFSKWGVRMVSFTPPNADFFCGKLIFGPRKKLSHHWLKASRSLYLSVMVGRFEATVENRTFLLKEGENLFFHASLKHSLANQQQRESVLLLVAAPSFL